MHIKQIINSLFSSNTYILFEEKEQNCWLIDCGDVDILIKWIDEHNKNLAGVFITHSHFDHIYGLNEIISVFPECKIFTSLKGREGLYSEKLNFSRYSGNNFILKYDNIVILKDNDSIELYPGLSLKTIETPGHDWSCLTFKTENHLFTGDSFLPDYKVITKFPKSNKIQAEKSISKIKNMIKLGTKNIYPGHGNIKCLHNNDNLTD